MLLQAAELKQGAAIADALLEQILASEDRADSSASAGTFSFLLALHAFATADARLVSPASDPAKFLRHLAPYLKVGAPTPAPPCPACSMTRCGMPPPPLLSQGSPSCPWFIFTLIACAMRHASQASNADPQPATADAAEAAARQAVARREAEEVHPIATPSTRLRA